MLVRPSEGPISQLFGNIQPDGNPHAGSDVAYTQGGVVYDKVLAAAEGVVLFAGDARGLTWPNIMYANPDFDRTDNVDSSAGNYTILAHYVGGERVALTGYAHQQEIWVRAGDHVRAGQQIGVVGTTGFSSGKHLHFDFVPAPFVVSRAPYYGRVDPEPFFNGLGLQAQGTITATEEDDMPTAKEIVDELLNRNIPREGEGQTGTTNLRAVIAWFDANNAGNVFQTATEVLNRKVPWFGFDGKGPTPGRDFTTLALATGYADTIGATQLTQLSALQQAVQLLAVKQGVVIDYDLLAEKAAKAVNDDAAKRMVK